MAAAYETGTPDSDSDVEAVQRGSGIPGGHSNDGPEPVGDSAAGVAWPSVSGASSTAGADNSADAGDRDARLVKESFAYLVSAGSAALEYFYARLFTVNPEMRSLFPMGMTSHRERVLAALTQVISRLDNRPGCTELLAELSRDHRKFGVSNRHYDAFFLALRDTVEHFVGTGWTPQVAAAWGSCFDYISAAMRDAAALDAAKVPPWWVAEIVGRELRSPGVAVLTLRPGQPLPYRPGQYVPVQVTRWPRVWRPYSIANSPRRSGLIKLHVRAVPGGMVSNTLVYHSDVGDSVLLGAPKGDMTLAAGDRDLLCLAGGTGLAPIKAIIEHALATLPLRPVALSAQAAGHLPAPHPPRKITLFVGARQHFDLYDVEDLQLLELACPALRVIPVLSEEPGYRGRTGMLPDVVRGQGLFENAEAYLCGPAPMVSQAAAVLAACMPAGQIHHDPLP